MKIAEKVNVKKLTAAGLCLALALVLPFFTGQIPQVGNMLCPMHLPVLLCGFLCGGPWGLAVGFAAPLVRNLLFGMPQIYPMGVSMAFELATYGAVSGALYARLRGRGLAGVYASLVTAMLAGRAVWGAARMVMTIGGGSGFGLAAFLAGAFTTAIPGIALQLVLVPALVKALEKAARG